MRHVQIAPGVTRLKIGVEPEQVMEDLDLAVANYTADSVSVLLGNGNGTFAGAVNYAASSGTSVVAFPRVRSDSSANNNIPPPTR